MNILIVDDEKQGRILIKGMLKEVGFEYSKIKEASSVQTAVSTLNSYTPDLLFLDIQLGDGNGFDILQAFPDSNFQIIFITGYDQYTIKALQHGATDYLLKPILYDDFEQALGRVHNKINNNVDINENAKTEILGDQRVLVKSGNKYNVLAYEEISALEAELSYTRFHLSNGDSVLSAYPLKHFVDKLDHPFIQIHRSWMVNLDLVKSYDKGRGGNILMINDLSIPIAFRRKADFITKFKEIQKD